MACNGSNVSRYVARPVRETLAILPYLAPVVEYPVKLVWEECCKATEDDTKKLYNAPAKDQSSPAMQKLGATHNNMRVTASKHRMQRMKLGLLFKVYCRDCP